ncbi:fatty acyl-AMP ligase [Limibaculum sp. M0105]|uniref:Fatty acyl-AMP ligase n=1 Tax=Thermohalobaculum xanthum TaxID=2753746 RepID=A0A8J7M808_9RHOB|nr:fatty acyl-AMP ligase [Thermohalobaculum xanthum]MBK0400279.1 fatty acyl-AMP ligase [Thermohalobaculum xanthum]
MEPAVERVEGNLAHRRGDFPTLTAALDYAARGTGSMRFHGPRGELVEDLSYARLADEAREAGARLLGLGLEPGDRVGLIAETDGDFMRGFMGCLHAGLIPAPMPLPAAFGSREAYAEQIRRIGAVAGIRAVLTPEVIRDWVVDAFAGSGLVYTGTLGAIPGEPRPLPAGTPASDAIAYLQFSSGTTSLPKGIAVSHAAMMANIRAMAEHGLDITADDRGVSWLPLYHDMGLVGCMFVPIAAQMPISYYATRDFVRRPGLWLKLISDTRATLSYAPSFGYDLAARRAKVDGLDLSSWRIAGIGGDMIKTGTLAAFAEAFASAGFDARAFLPSYGMAEATLGLTFAPLGQGCRAVSVELARLDRGEVAPAEAGSPGARSFAVCGSALPEHEVIIADETGAPLPAGRVGHILARGPSLMTGYFGDEQATRAALSADGWLDTGDLGFFDGDELVVTGRAKDLIIINGRNIWPQDIEWAIESGAEGVRAGGVAAFGVTPSDGDGGTAEETVTVVAECRVSDPNARATLREHIHALVRERIGIEVEVTLAGPGVLPRTSSGKLSRARAREMFLAGVFAA